MITNRTYRAVDGTLELIKEEQVAETIKTKEELILEKEELLLAMYQELNELKNNN